MAPLSGGLLDLGGVVRLRCQGHRVAVLPQLLGQRLRTLAGLLEDQVGLLAFRGGQVQRLRRALADALPERTVNGAGLAGVAGSEGGSGGRLLQAYCKGRL